METAAVLHHVPKRQVPRHAQGDGHSFGRCGHVGEHAEARRVAGYVVEEERRASNLFHVEVGETADALVTVGPVDTAELALGVDAVDPVSQVAYRHSLGSALRTGSDCPGRVWTRSTGSMASSFPVQPVSPVGGDLPPARHQTACSEAAEFLVVAFRPGVQRHHAVVAQVFRRNGDLDVPEMRRQVLVRERRSGPCAPCSFAPAGRRSRPEDRPGRTAASRRSSGSASRARYP